MASGNVEQNGQRITFLTKTDAMRRRSSGKPASFEAICLGFRLHSFVRKRGGAVVLEPVRKSNLFIRMN